MTNREYYKDQILDIACKGGSLSIYKITGELCKCGTFECDDCLFDNCECENQIKHWANAEYIEKPKLTKNENCFLSLLNERWKYMARDKNGTLYLYDQKPAKGNYSGVWNDISENYPIRIDTLMDDDFSMIKWEDEEPWSIEDLKNLPVEEN